MSQYNPYLSLLQVVYPSTHALGDVTEEVAKGYLLPLVEQLLTNDHRKFLNLRYGLETGRNGSIQSVARAAGKQHFETAQILLEAEGILREAIVKAQRDDVKYLPFPAHEPPRDVCRISDEQRDLPLDLMGLSKGVVKKLKAAKFRRQGAIRVYTRYELRTQCHLNDTELDELERVMESKGMRLAAVMVLA